MQVNKNELHKKPLNELKVDRDIAKRVMADEQKLIDLQRQDAEAARKIFEFKKAHTKIINGRPEYEQCQEYYDLIAQREECSVAKIELQYRDNKSRFDTRLEQHNKTLEAIQGLIDTAVENGAEEEVEDVEDDTE